MTRGLDANGKIYMAANAILQPSKFSVSSMAILQQTSNSLRWTFYQIFHGSKTMPRNLELVKSIYNTLKVDNQICDGNRPYPQEDCKTDGMSIDVRYVLRFQMLMWVHLQGGRNLSFSYPGSKSTKDALTGVSFSIKAGQLVVIVGPNGSGKSTIVKILNRLYDPTSGEVLVDGQLMNSYRIADLRQATADLTQDHTLYPLPYGRTLGSDILPVSLTWNQSPSQRNWAVLMISYRSLNKGSPQRCIHSGQHVWETLVERIHTP